MCSDAACERDKGKKVGPFTQALTSLAGTHWYYLKLRRISVNSCEA